MSNTFVAKLSLYKSVDDWGPDGASGKHRDIDYHKGAVSADSLKSIHQEITQWVSQFGLDFAKFSVFDEDDKIDDSRRFTFCQVEDENSFPDDNGAYLADYYLRVTLAQSIECPTFGLPIE